MKKNKLVKLIFLCSIFLVSPLFSNENIKSFSFEQKNFVNNYIRAVNSNDLDKLKALSHPKYLKCINSSNKDYFDSLYEKSLKRNIPKEYKVSIKKLTSEYILNEIKGATKIGLPYPSEPTHILQIDFNKSEYSFVTIVRNLRLENGKYYGVSGCPSNEMIKKFRQMKVKKEKFRKDAKELFGKLNEPLLSQLKKLLNEGQRIKAWKKYSEEAGTSIAMAKEVLSHIKTQN